MFSMENIHAFVSMISAALALQPSAAPDAIQVCDQALHLIETNPLCAQTVSAVSRASIELEGMTNSLRLIQFHECSYRSRILVTISGVHTWIHQTVDTGLHSHPDHAGTWPANLIDHIKWSMSNQKPGTRTVIKLSTFISEVPSNLPDFTYTIPQQTSDVIELEDRIRKKAVQALQTWLGYETPNPASAASASIFMSMRISPLYPVIFMMDGAWLIYQRPFFNVIHGGAGYNRQAAWTEDTLAQFKSAFTASPLCDSSSPEFRALAGIRDILNGTKQSVRMSVISRTRMVLILLPVSISALLAWDPSRSIILQVTAREKQPRTLRVAKAGLV